MLLCTEKLANLFSLSLIILSVLLPTDEDLIITNFEYYFELLG